MRIVAMKAPLRRALRWTRHILLAGGVLALGYCSYVAIDAWHFQKEQRAQLEHLLRDRQASSRSPQDSLPAAKGSLIGRIDIPRLGLSVIVIEGVDHTTLRR